MLRDTTYFKNFYLEKIEQEIREDLAFFDIIDDDHYDFEFDRIKDVRLRDFDLNWFFYYQDWVSDQSP